MNKTQITVATIGSLPVSFDKRKIEKWDSEIFSIVGNIENYTLTEDRSDGLDWSWSDECLEAISKSIWRCFHGLLENKSEIT